MQSLVLNATVQPLVGQAGVSFTAVVNECVKCDQTFEWGGLMKETEKKDDADDEDKERKSSSSYKRRVCKHGIPDDRSKSENDWNPQYTTSTEFIMDFITQKPCDLDVELSWYRMKFHVDFGEYIKRHERLPYDSVEDAMEDKFHQD